MLGRIRTARGVLAVVGNLGFLAVALGVVLWIEGYGFVGIVIAAFGGGVLYAVGYWAVPWATPGWYRRTVRAWRDWMGAVNSSQDVARRKAAEIGAHVQAVAVPQRFVAEAPPVVAQFQPDLSKPDRSELDKRLRESAARLEAAAAGVARIESEALSPEERAYAAALCKALDDRLGATARMYEDARAASRRLATFLGEANAPSRHDELQSQMAAAAQGYARVMESARAAAVARDFQTLGNLAELLAPAAAEMQRCRDGLLAASPVRRKP
jgi:hypothetical protein